MTDKITNKISFDVLSSVLLLSFSSDVLQTIIGAALLINHFLDSQIVIIEGAAISGPPKGVLKAKLSITITRVYTGMYRNQSNTTIILYTYKLKKMSQHGD
jgi:hypothetical protein